MMLHRAELSLGDLATTLTPMGVMFTNIYILLIGFMTVPMDWSGFIWWPIWIQVTENLLNFKNFMQIFGNLILGTNAS